MIEIEVLSKGKLAALSKNVRGGLLKGQREPAQFLQQLIRRRSLFLVEGIPGALRNAQQKLARRLMLENIEMNGSDQGRTPAGIAAGDQRSARAGLRDPLLSAFLILSV